VEPTIFERVLIDNGAFARIAFEKMYPAKGEYEFTTPAPTMDFGVLYLKALAMVKGAWCDENSEIVICFDPKDSATCFRHQIINDYYEKYLWVAQRNVEDREYLCSFDGKHMILKWDNITDSWVSKKATAKLSREYLAAGFAYVPRADIPLDVSHAIDKCVRPNYKQGRSWNYAHMPKEDFNEMRWVSALKAAYLTGSYIFEDEQLEADDLVFRAAQATTKKTLILTVDSDINQTLLLGDHVSIYNLRTHRMINRKPETLKYELWSKLLLGETKKGSDNIMPAVVKKTGSPMAPKPADKLARDLVEMKTQEEKDQALEATVHDFTFQKNVSLMLLSSAPEPRTVISTAPVVDVTLEDMYTSQAELDLETTQARNQRMANTFIKKEGE
jgi:hypothetical protein